MMSGVINSALNAVQNAQSVAKSASTTSDVFGSQPYTTGVTNTSASKISDKPDINKYLVKYEGRNPLERFGDWVTGINYENEVSKKQDALYKQYEADYNEYMENTKVQRLVEDLKSAGLNPWLAIQNGFSAGGSTASVSGTQTRKSSSNGSSLKDVASSALKIGLLIKVLSGIF